MAKFKTACWSLLAVLGVGAIEPALVAATSRSAASSSAILRIDRAECLNGQCRASLTTTDRLGQEVALHQPGATPMPNPTAVPPRPSFSPTPTPSFFAPADLRLFGSQNVPTAVRLRDLTSEWRAMGTNGPIEIGNLQMLVNTSAGGSFAMTYYTKGQTVTLGSETYVVAYSLFTVADKVTPDLPLGLSLLNIKTVGSLSNIRAFDVVKETKVLERQLAMIKLANMFDPTESTRSPEPDPVESQDPVVTPSPTTRPTRRPVRRPQQRRRTNTRPRRQR